MSAKIDHATSSHPKFSRFRPRPVQTGVSCPCCPPQHPLCPPKQATNGPNYGCVSPLSCRPPQPFLCPHPTSSHCRFRQSPHMCRTTPASPGLVLPQTHRNRLVEVVGPCKDSRGHRKWHSALCTGRSHTQRLRPWFHLGLFRQQLLLLLPVRHLRQGFALQAGCRTLLEQELPGPVAACPHPETAACTTFPPTAGTEMPVSSMRYIVEAFCHVGAATMPAVAELTAAGHRASP